MTARTLAPFERDILDELLDAQRRLHTAPAIASRRPPLRRRQLTIAVTVAAALGAGTAIIVATDSTPTAPNRPEVVGNHPVEPIRAQTVAAITRRTSAALATVNDMVLHTRETRTLANASGAHTEIYDTWSDRGDPEHSRSTYTRDGQQVYDIQTDSAAPSELLVDYPNLTWYRGPTIDYSNQHLAGSTPDRIRQQLDAGGLTLVGHETIDGRDTLHLSRHDIGLLTGDLWVDASSYLVVRSTNATGTTDYEWLERNATSRSQLVPVVPAGFTFGGLPPSTPLNPDGSAG